MFEGADETDVGWSEAGGGGDEAVVEQGVGTGVFHEGFEATPWWEVSIYVKRRCINEDMSIGRVIG